MNLSNTLDQLDLDILNTLIRDAKTSYAEMAKQFNVSTGTIHVRVEKMRQSGIIVGTKIKVDQSLLGFDVCCFIGIILKSAKDYETVIEELTKIPEIVEAYYTTGAYSIFIKLISRNIKELHQILISKIQVIDEIQSTETFISMDTPIDRDIIPKFS